MDAGAVGQQRQQHLGEVRVQDDHPVIGVVDHVDDLVRHEEGVERLEHRTHRPCAEEHLEVLSGVRHHGADPFADAGADQVVQGVGEGGGP